MNMIQPELSWLGSITTTTVSVWGLILLVALAWVKIIPAMRQLSIQRAESLEGRLIDRVTKLETDLAEQIKGCALEQAVMRREAGDREDAIRREFAAERAALNAEIAKLHDALDALRQQVTQYRKENGNAV